MVWLTSADGYEWNEPRLVDVTDVRTDPGSGRSFAVLELAVGQPGGPRTLLASPRHESGWFVPAAGEVLRVGVWAASDRAAAWARLDGLTAAVRPDHWCSLTTDEPTARRVARGALGG